MSKTYYDLKFLEKLDRAMKRGSSLLEASIRPVRLDEEPHRYDDKFSLAESSTFLAVDAVTSFLATGFGVGDDAKKTKGLALKFGAVETCESNGEREDELKGPKVTVSREKTTFFGSAASDTTTQVSAKIATYVWTNELVYTASLVDPKNGFAEVRPLFRRTARRELTTTVKDHAPKPKRKEFPEAVFELDPLLLRQEGVCRIDRLAATCATPRRNDLVIAMLDTFKDLARFIKAVKAPFMAFGGGASAAACLKDIDDAAGRVFSAPACAFLLAEEKNIEDEAPTTTPTTPRLAPPPREEVAKEVRRTFEEQRGVVRRTFEADSDAKTPFGPEEAELLFCVAVAEAAARDYDKAVAYLEAMLRQQVDAAVGKELTAEAFEEYAAYHDRLVFRSDFRPGPFSYAVRRDRDAFPDGTVSIASAAKKEPIRTFARDATETTSPFTFAIGAATFVTFDGPRYAHAYVARTFGGRKPEPLQLVAKARPFSGYVLLLGKVAAKDEFVAERAVVVQSSDEVMIPLLLDPLPTPKEFADAIESLSPEQREFCEAFRRMQLASSLFGVVLVQLKPAIEKVLNLPRGALTKEIALTDHLMELFIDYQIPTDMLSYDDDADRRRQKEDDDDAFRAKKIEKVKSHVAAIRGVIQAARDDDLKKAKEESLHRKYEKGVAEDLEEELVEELALSASLKTRIQPRDAAAAAAAAPFGGGGPSKRHFQARASRRGGGGGPAPPLMATPMAMASTSFAAAAAAPVAEAAPRGGRRHEEAEQAPHLPAELEDFESFDTLDMTQIPKKLDANFKRLDTDSQLRPTTIKADDRWTRLRKTSIVAAAARTTLGDDDLAKERTKAFDLLDALSRSGALILGDAELHVIVCATHAFDKSITDTLVVDNVDPILKAERASLIIATTLHDDKTALDIVQPKKLPSLAKSSPFLLPAATSSEGEKNALPQAEEAL